MEPRDYERNIRKSDNWSLASLSSLPFNVVRSGPVVPSPAPHLRGAAGPHRRDGGAEVHRQAGPLRADPQVRVPLSVPAEQRGEGNQAGQVAPHAIQEDSKKTEL